MWRVKKLCSLFLAENLVLEMEKQTRWTQEKSLLRTAASEPFGADSDFCDLVVKSQFLSCRCQQVQGSVSSGFNSPWVDSVQLDQVSVWLGSECRGSPWAVLGKGQAGRTPFPRHLGAPCGKGSVLATSGRRVLWISTKLVRWHQHILLGSPTAGVAQVRRKETCRTRNFGARDGRVIFFLREQKQTRSQHMLWVCTPRIFAWFGKTSPIKPKWLPPCMGESCACSSDCEQSQKYRFFGSHRKQETIHHNLWELQHTEHVSFVIPALISHIHNSCKQTVFKSFPHHSL